MRGLPPLPADFITLTAEWQCSLAAFTTAWHLHQPGGSSRTPDELADLISQWFEFCLPDLLSVLPVDAICVTCRAASSGAFGAQITEPLADNHGAFGATTPINAALVLTWRSQDGPNGARSHSWLPLADAFLDDNLRQLRQISYAEAGSAARSYALHMNGLVTAPDQFCTFAVVQRSRNGAPLPASLWSPVQTGDASRFVGTIRRRVKPRR